MPRVLKRSRKSRGSSATPASVETDMAEIDLEAEARSGQYDTVADLRSPGARVWHPGRAWARLSPKIAQALQTIVMAAGSSVLATSAYRLETENDEQSAKETMKARKLFDPGSSGAWQLIQSIAKSSDSRGQRFAFRPAAATGYFLVVDGAPVHLAEEIAEARPNGSSRVSYRDTQLSMEFLPIESGIDQETGQAWFGWHIANHGNRTIRLGAPWLQVGDDARTVDLATAADFQAHDNRAFALPPEGIVLAPYGCKKYVFFQYASRTLTAAWLRAEQDPQKPGAIIKAQLRWFAGGDDVSHNHQIVIALDLQVRKRPRT